MVLAAHDAGSARVLFPVADELKRRGVDSLAIIAGPAEKIWREEASHLPGRVVPDEIPVDVLCQHLTDWGANALLSGSGGYTQLEHHARLAARQLGLPVTAVFDSWLHYAERFQREENGAIVESRPDRICAIDEWTREGAIAAGLDPASIFVTGHPDLEKTARHCRVSSEDERRELRKSLGVEGDGLLVVFFSDPFYVGPDLEYYSGPGALMYPDGRSLYGYTVREILPVVLQELEAAMVAADTSCDLIVRPHPWEHDGALRAILDDADLRRVRVRLTREAPVAQWIQCADALMGMMTIALLHAALAGKPSVSVEIGLRESGQEDPCVSNILGYTRGVFDLESLRVVCGSIARREWAELKTTPKYILPLEGAAARVADVLLGSVREAGALQPC